MMWYNKMLQIDKQIPKLSDFPFAWEMVPVADLLPGNDSSCRDPLQSDGKGTFVEDIRSHGIIHDLLVCKIDGSPQMKIFVGGRRGDAAREIGLSVVPCRVYPSSVPREVRILASLEENRQRGDLTPIEMARAIKLLFGLIGEDYELAAKVLDATVPEIKRWIASLGPMEVLQKAGFLIRERDVDKVFLIQDVLPSYLLELTFKEVQAMDMPKVRKVVKGIEVEWKAGKKGIDVTAIADKVKENVPVSGISMTVIIPDPELAYAVGTAKQLGHFNTKSEYVVSLIEKDCIARGIYAKKSE